MIHIIVPVHNRSKTTNKFADCLLTQTNQNYNLILVDDGSTDDTVKTIKKKIKNLTLLNGDGNLWWAGGIQLGIEWLKKNIKNKSEVVLIVNDDITFNKFFLECALNIIKTSNKTFLIAGYEIQKENPNFNVNCFSMNSTFCKFKYLEDIGDFHPQILPHYLADIEYSYRAIQKGYKLITSDNVKVKWDTKSTGIHDVEEISLIEYCKIVFSKKYSSNPIYWTYFYYLTMKKKYLFLRIIFFWIKFIFKIIYKLITSVKRKKHSS